MASQKLIVGRYYSLKTGSVDTVVIKEVDKKWVYFTYANCEAVSLFRDRRKLPKEVFLKCYEYNKVCNVLFGNYDEVGFVRIGEEANDIEERGCYDHNIFVETSISMLSTDEVELKNLKLLFGKSNEKV